MPQARAGVSVTTPARTTLTSGEVQEPRQLQLLLGRFIRGLLCWGVEASTPDKDVILILDDRWGEEDPVPGEQATPWK